MEETLPWCFRTHESSSMPLRISQICEHALFRFLWTSQATRLFLVLEGLKKRVRAFGSSSSSTVAMEVHPHRQIFDIPVMEAEYFM